MPEGDTIYRTATTLRRALIDRRLTAATFRDPSLKERAARLALVDRTVASVEARGKHLLIAFRRADSPDVTLHTHMRMRGEWHVYRPGEPWQRAASRAVVVLHTDAYVTPCFEAPVVELLTATQLARHPALTRLGPDVTADDPDRAGALTRLRAHGDREIGDAIMRQSLIAGVGNAYKSEVLFLARVSPFARVADLDDETLACIITLSHDLLHANRDRPWRRTYATLRVGERLWVFERTGRPCRVCGAAIQSRKQGHDLRTTYFCTTCQAVSAPRRRSVETPTGP